MKLTSLVFTLALLPAALFAANAPTVIPGGAFASTYVISSPGSYVLGGNRSANTSIYVIEIAAPDVTLDLNGFKLSNVVGGSKVGGGIHVPTPENVEIRNGTIADAGNFGIRAKAGKGIRVTDVRVAGADYAGIYLETAAAQVDRCNVTDSVDYGIWASGGGALITDCVVNGLANASGVTVANGAKVLRTTARGCAKGFQVFSSTAVDCIATGNSVGFHLSDCATLRGIESIKNTAGAFTNETSNLIVGSRITNNTNTFSGLPYYTNGGGNMIQ